MEATCNNFNFVWFSHRYTSETAQYMVMKFCKNAVFCGVYKLTSFNINLRAMSCGLCWLVMEWLRLNRLDQEVINVEFKMRKELIIACFKVMSLVFFPWLNWGKPWKPSEKFVSVNWLVLFAFWDIAPCGLVEVDQRFWGAYYLNH
jgi:hypothetical protein